MNKKPIICIALSILLLVTIPVTTFFPFFGLVSLMIGPPKANALSADQLQNKQLQDTQSIYPNQFQQQLYQQQQKQQQQQQQQNLPSSSITNAIPQYPYSVTPYTNTNPYLFQYRNSLPLQQRQQAPIANAGLSQTVDENTVVMLDARSSYDPDGGTIISYSWTQLANPGSIPVELIGANTATPIFTAPSTMLPYNNTLLMFSLQVKDSDSATTSSNTAMAYVVVRHHYQNNNNPENTLGQQLANPINPQYPSLYQNPYSPPSSQPLQSPPPPSQPLLERKQQESQPNIQTQLKNNNNNFSSIATSPIFRGNIPSSSLAAVAGATSTIPTLGSQQQQQQHENTTTAAQPNPTIGLSSTTTTTNSACQTLTIGSVSAIGYQSPNIPSNVIDGNFNTRWAQYGYGSWIQANLGAQKVVCSVDIAWYQGNARQYNFVISVSTNGYSFTNVFTGKSSGSTTAFERYTFPEIAAKYVRIIVNGNSQNSWASIYEISIAGYTNNPPVANAGPDQIVNSGSSVKLDGIASYDPDGNPITYSWIQVAGSPIVSLSGANTANPSFSSPYLTSDTTLTFKLTVKDKFGLSSSDTINVLVIHNRPPVANAGPDQTVNSGSSVKLDGTASYDPDGNPITYSWIQVSGSPTVTLSGANTANPTFTAPSLTADTTLTFQLTVTDKGGSSSTDTVNITILHSSSPPSPPPPTVDKFGVTELYPTKQNGGEEWYINVNDPTTDSRNLPPTLTKNPDGSFKVQSTSVRWQVYTSSGFHPEQITTYDQTQLTAKGYMQSPNDWKNVEITAYLKVNHYTTSTTNGAAHIELLARGGRHTSSFPCEGTAYHSNTYETGRAKFEKELEHTAGYTADSQDPQLLGATGTLQGKWIGIKAVFYNLPNGSVKLEQWLDDKTDNINVPGNQWHKVLEFTDSGSWGGGTPNCGGTPTTIITWGGPIVHFRWDNIDDMDVKDLSVREIQPSSP